MPARSRLISVARLIVGAVRYYAASRECWGSVAEAWRYFWASHRPSADHTECFRVCVGNLRLKVRPSEWCSFDEVCVRDEYAFVDVILAGIAQPRVLDLGANIGLFSARVLARHGRAKICALEPGASAFDVLRLNVSENPAHDWRPWRCAVWHSEGYVDFHEARYSTASRVTSGGDPVPAITLRQAIARLVVKASVDLVKMDIEGAEQVVLASDEAALDRVACIAVEIHPALCDANAVIGLLKRKFGYLYQISGRHSNKPLILASRASYALPAL